MDASWVACTMAREKSEPEIIAVTANFFNALARKIPSIVTPILDGEKRHNLKHDLTKRVAT